MERRCVLIVGLVFLAMGLVSCGDLVIRDTSTGPTPGYPGQGPENHGGYRAGYQDGYHEGYNRGYRDGVRGKPFEPYPQVGLASGPYGHGRYDGIRAGYEQGFRDGRAGQGGPNPRGTTIIIR